MTLIPDEQLTEVSTLTRHPIPHPIDPQNRNPDRPAPLVPAEEPERATRTLAAAATAVATTSKVRIRRRRFRHRRFASAMSGSSSNGIRRT